MTTRELQAEVGRAQSFVAVQTVDTSIVTLENLKAVIRKQDDKEDELIMEYGRQATDYVFMRTSTYWEPRARSRSRGRATTPASCR